MSAFTPYVSFISGYIPAAVKDAAGLCPKISEAVRHITWLSVERVFWPPRDAVRFLLVLGYTDGFQIWDLQDPTAVHEVCSKQDKAVVQARLLPVPLAPVSTRGILGGGGGTGAAEDEANQLPLGFAAAPLMAYLHRGAPALVRLFSLRQHDDVHLLRLTEPARSLQASRRYFAVGFARRVQLYDALGFQALFSVDCNTVAGPTFALGHRWLAYNLPPQQPPSAPGSAVGLGGAAGGLLAGGPRQLQSAMREGLQYLGQGVQRALDHVLMPPPEGSEQQPAAPTAARGGVVAVRDAASQRVLARFEDHMEPVEAMAWDPSGLQLVSGAALGHRVLVHRALLGAEHALVMHDSAEGGLALGSVVFQHSYTLSRGYTPAVISDIAVSDDGQLVAVSSAKGTTHVFRLPPLHSASFGHHLTETGAVRLTPSPPCATSAMGDLGTGLSLGSGHVVPRPLTLTACTRVRLGHLLLQEGLMPKCGFLTPAQPATSSRSSPHPRDVCPRMYVATRAGALALYSLSPGPSPGAAAAGSSGAEGAASGMGPSGGSVGGVGVLGGGCGASGAGGRAGGAGTSGGSSAAGIMGTRAAGESGEWQATLTKEVHVCRPLRHFTERRLRPQDLLASGGGQGRRTSSASSSSSSAAAAAGAGDAQGEPRLRPQSSPTLAPRPSPTLGPRPSFSPGPRSPLLGPSASGPFTDEGLQAGAGAAASSSAAAGLSSGAAGGGAGTAAATEPSKWLSSVELATHVPREVPLWLCPQLSFYAYPPGVAQHELNAALRSGLAPPGRRRIQITRPERPGDGVRYDGGASSPGYEEKLSRLFGGALGTSVGEALPEAAEDIDIAIPAFRSPRGGGSVCVAPAWGFLGEQHLEAGGLEGSFEQADGGAGVAGRLEEVEEDWLDVSG